MKRALTVYAFVVASTCYACAGDAGGEVRTVAPPIAGAAPHTPAELADATRIVWSALEHLRWPNQTVTVTMPVVTWITPPALDCADGTGIRGADGVCYAGWFNADWTAHVTLPPGRTLAGDGILAHELCHGIAWLDGGDGDPAHTGVCFQAGGWVEQANAALAAQGAP